MTLRARPPLVEKQNTDRLQVARGISVIHAVLSASWVFVLAVSFEARADAPRVGGSMSDGGAPRVRAADTPNDTPSALPHARGPIAAVDVRGDRASLRFSLPLKVPAWFLWQHATDCQAYLRSIKEVKRCEYFTEGGKPAVFLQAEIFGRRYGVVVGIQREFRRGHGKVEFESKNTETAAKGALRVDSEGEGVSRLSFDARMPRDPSVPSLLWRIAVHAAVQASTAKIRGDLEAAYAVVKDKREAPTDLVLKKGRPAPAPRVDGPPANDPTIPSPPVQAPRP